MNNKIIFMIVTAIVLGMLVLKEICGCKVVEGQQFSRDQLDADGEVRESAALVNQMLDQNDGTNVGITTLVDNQGQPILQPGSTIDLETILENGCIIQRLVDSQVYTYTGNPNNNWQGNACKRGTSTLIQVEPITVAGENVDPGIYYCQNSCTSSTPHEFCQYCCETAGR